MARGPVVFFRLDADARIGAGHLMRCLALADGFRRRGRRPIFVTRNMPANMAALGCRRRFDRVALASFLPPSREIWALARRPDGNRALGIVVDRYGFPSNYLAPLARLQLSWTSLQFDDLGAPLSGVDLILNQNPSARPAMYRRASRMTRLLLGPRYAVLRPEFLSRAPRQPRATVRRLVVTTGGGHLPSVVSTLARWTAEEANGADVTVVTGFGGKNGLSDLGSRVDVRSSVANMAALLAGADLVVTAAGTTLIELAYLRVPSVSVVVSDNQAPGARAASRAGLTLSLGRFDGLKEIRFRRALRGLLDSVSARRRMAARQARAVDGRGVDRVLDAFEEAGL